MYWKKEKVTRELVETEKFLFNKKTKWHWHFGGALAPHLKWLYYFVFI